MLIIHRMINLINYPNSKEQKSYRKEEQTMEQTIEKIYSMRKYKGSIKAPKGYHEGQFVWLSFKNEGKELTVNPLYMKKSGNFSARLKKVAYSYLYFLFNKSGKYLNGSLDEFEQSYLRMLLDAALPKRGNKKNTQFDEMFTAVMKVITELKETDSPNSYRLHLAAFIKKHPERFEEQQIKDSWEDFLLIQRNIRIVKGYNKELRIYCTNFLNNSEYFQPSSIYISHILMPNSTVKVRPSTEEELCFKIAKRKDNPNQLTRAVCPYISFTPLQKDVLGLDCSTENWVKVVIDTTGEGSIVLKKVSDKELSKLMPYKKTTMAYTRKRDWSKVISAITCKTCIRSNRYEIPHLLIQKFNLTAGDDVRVEIADDSVIIHGNTKQCDICDAEVDTRHKSVVCGDCADTVQNIRKEVKEHDNNIDKTLFDIKKRMEHMVKKIGTFLPDDYIFEDKGESKC